MIGYDELLKAFEAYEEKGETRAAGLGRLGVDVDEAALFASVLARGVLPAASLAVQADACDLFFLGLAVGLEAGSKVAR